jgi:hypothetical protein
VQTRQDQASEFSQTIQKEGQKGWVIDKKKFHYSDNAQLDEKDLEEIKRISKFIWNCGQEENGLNDNFDVFLRKTIKDSLELDNVGVEKVRTRTNKFYGFKVVDGATIYKAKPFNDPKYGEISQEGNPPKKNGYYPTHCQVFRQSTVQATFYPDEMFTIIRNPSSSVSTNGYGTSEYIMVGSLLKGLLLKDSLALGEKLLTLGLKTLNSNIKLKLKRHQTLKRS